MIGSLGLYRPALSAGGSAVEVLIILVAGYDLPLKYNTPLCLLALMSEASSNEYNRTSLNRSEHLL